VGGLPFGQVLALSLHGPQDAVDEPRGGVLPDLPSLVVGLMEHRMVGHPRQEEELVHPESQDAQERGVRRLQTPAQLGHERVVEARLEARYTADQLVRQAAVPRVELGARARCLERGLQKRLALVEGAQNLERDLTWPVQGAGGLAGVVDARDAGAAR
jgi:hypothetical protein